MKGDVMIDRSQAGMRCRTIRFVRTVSGDLPKEAQGTIRYSMENLGRQLILVEWDRGFTVPVFPHEIEMSEFVEARL
jgi:hypothetical protein